MQLGLVHAIHSLPQRKDVLLALACPQDPAISKNKLGPKVLEGSLSSEFLKRNQVLGPRRIRGGRKENSYSHSVNTHVECLLCLETKPKAGCLASLLYSLTTLASASNPRSVVSSSRPKRLPGKESSATPAAHPGAPPHGLLLTSPPFSASGFSG